MKIIFTGDYHFFDYKYDIPGYSGQDFGGIGQYLYLAISAVLLMVLLIFLRKTPRAKALRIVGFLGIFLTFFYIGKTSWETVHDIRHFGMFNTGILPLDACSVIMPAGILAGFGKGKIGDAAVCWVATGGIVCGLSNLLFLNALYFYPFLSFGALYSMLWHFLMVFMGLFLLVTVRPRVDFSTVIKGYIFHLGASLIVIPIDYIFDFDFMLYRHMGGIPFFEDLATKITEARLEFLNTLIMLVLYFVSFCLVWLIAAGIKNRKGDYGKRFSS